MFVQVDTPNGFEWVNIMHVRRVQPGTPTENGDGKLSTLHFDDGATLTIKMDAGEAAVTMSGAIMGMLYTLGQAVQKIALEDSKKGEGDDGTTPPDTAG